MSCLNENKAAELDQIPAKLNEMTAGVLVYPLSRTIYLSVKLSIFLEESKIVKLKPLFKKKLNPSQKL